MPNALADNYFQGDFALVRNHVKRMGTIGQRFARFAGTQTEDGCRQVQDCRHIVEK
jgi:hypothetical protein